MRDDTLAAIRARIGANHADRTKVRTLVRSGKADEAEDDLTRKVAFEAHAARPMGVAEAVVDTNDFQPASFLTDGAATRRSVARVLVQTPAESRSGSGFLISPDLFITNQHVIKDSNDARNASLFFDDELDHSGRPQEKTAFHLDPDRLALFSDENDLDFAIVALGERTKGAGTVADFGNSPLSFTPDRHRKGMNGNIVQHPNGQPKIIAIRNNLLTARDDTRLYYETDTDVGSSGSPVYNDLWEVVALHHYGDVANGGSAVNEGVRISAIYQELQQRVAQLDPVSQEIVQRALLLWKDTTTEGKKLERRPPPHVTHEAAVDTVATPAEESTMKTSGDSVSLVVPLEISLRVAAPFTAKAAVTTREESDTPAPRLSAKRLRTGAEAIKLDADYSNRNGFDSQFVPGLKLDLKTIVKPRKADVAPLLQGSAANGGFLHYQNFSLVMHRARRLALFTATNIDGVTYVAIDRKTGEPATRQPEGETWFRDQRIDEASTITQDFYSGWSHLFDRGHLTRRNDPTWGEFATRANADTFHFTNCSPQHWKFNESIQFWQGIERYVLEKGLFASGRSKPITVLQGPVLDDDNDLWAEPVQVPSAFWKIVVWRGKTGHKAVALIADQTKLFSLERKGGIKPPGDDADIEVSEFRSTVASIEEKTGLDLSAIRPHDVAGDDLPVVGERARLITKWADLGIG